MKFKNLKTGFRLDIENCFPTKHHIEVADFESSICLHDRGFF